MSHILLVDDDTSVLLTLAIALRRRGFVVTVAQSAWQALGLLARQEYNLLISDVRMPGMSGLQLAERVHLMEHPPRVILTSALDVDTSQNHVDAFFPKPLDVEKLAQLVGQEWPQQIPEGFTQPGGKAPLLTKPEN